jgi:type VI secretion system secreted protein Hcp
MANVDMFIKLGDIKGESQDSSHKGEIDVLAWSWGMNNAASGHTGSGSGSGKVNVQDLSFTKYVDTSTPNLMAAVCSGKHYPEATLVVRKSGDKPLEYIKIKFSDVMVTSVSAGGSGGEARLTENVTLNFSKFYYDYTPQKKDGAADAKVSANWDIAANIKI